MELCVRKGCVRSAQRRGKLCRPHYNELPHGQEKVHAGPLVQMLRRSMKDRWISQPNQFSETWSSYEKSHTVPMGPRGLSILWADRFGGQAKNAERMFVRLFAGQRWVTLDTADKLCVFLGTSLEAMYGPVDDEECA